MLWLVVVAGCGGSSDEPEPLTREQQCVQLRDHLVDLRLADATHLDQAGHRAALTQALGAAFFDQCTEALSDGQVACALAAVDTNGASDCYAKRSQK